MGWSWKSSTLSASWDGSEWSEIETPQPSEELFVDGATLSSVSCLSTTSCVAVGSFAAYGGEEGDEEKTLTEVWDGSEWTTRPSTGPDVFSTLAAVSCTSTSQCTAVGSARPIDKDTNNMVTLGERWNGSEWTTQATLSPETRTELNLSDVSCTSATKCMAVGYNKFMGRTFAEFWDGSAWKIVQSNLGTNTEPAVSCVALPHCHIVATTANGTQGTWIYFQPSGGSNWGSTFRAFAAPEGASAWKLRDVSCSSESACTAVGYAHISGKYKTLVERYDGTSWSIQESPEPSKGNGYNALASVSCPTAQYCLAVGKADSKPFAEEWDGTEWTLAPVGVSEAGTLEDVSCVSATSCTAVGYLGWWDSSYGFQWVEGETLIESWDGSEWTEIEAPEPSEEPLASDARLSAVSCTSTTSCLAVGAFLTEEGEQGNEEKALAEIWDGSEWVTQPSPASPAVFSALAGVSCTAPGQCTGVGAARPEFNGTNNMVTLGEEVDLPPVPSTEDDPKVEVEASSSLVDSVEGDEAGQIAYEHEDELLTAVNGPTGETAYEYDSNERMTKVTLPTGTWGQVAYSETDGRVKSVTVDPAGEEPAKTTYFVYQDSPSRRTTVSPEGDPATIYDIGADGSVLRWWNTPTPPELETLSGSLYQNKETPQAITPGDYALSITAHSAEGITSIEVIANGSTLVDEKTCEQEWETPERECQTVENLWVTNTGSWPPGILSLDVIATDANGNVESTKFWANIPYTPPPDPEADEPPTFEDVLHFREEFGLDLDLKGDEQAISERIFDLIGAWYNPNTPSGEIARATYQRWGSPLRPVDAAEMEYREHYVATVGSMLEQWGNSVLPNSYAGYYVDNPDGGIIRVGFTGQSLSNLALFKQQLNPPAQGRLEGFLAPEALSAEALVKQEDAISTLLETNQSLGSLVGEVWVDYQKNTVEIGTTNVGQTSQLLQAALGTLKGIDVISQPQPQYSSGRNRVNGRMLAGDRVLIKESDSSCTAGFGAYERRHRKSDGALINAPFFLTAGHCFAVGIKVWRSPYSGYGGKTEWNKLGEVTRSPYELGAGVVDAEAVRLEAAGVAPRQIYGRNGNRPKFEDPVVGHRGQELCFSGAFTGGVRCGEVVGIRKVKFAGVPRPCGCLKIAAPNIPGDSGSPVWDPRTHAAVGLLRGYIGEFTLVQPLLDTPNNKGSVYAGVLDSSKMYDLHLMSGG